MKTSHGSNHPKPQLKNKNLYFFMFSGEGDYLFRRSSTNSMSHVIEINKTNNLERICYE